LVAQQRRGQGRVDEPRGDEVDPDRREFEREVGVEGRERSGLNCRDRIAEAGRQMRRS
jgi:hypothetical protein